MNDDGLFVGDAGAAAQFVSLTKKSLYSCGEDEWSSDLARARQMRLARGFGNEYGRVCGQSFFFCEECQAVEGSFDEF